MQVMGHGKSKHLAEYNALCHGILNLQERELLNHMKPGGKYSPVDEKQVEKEANAKVEVFTYCARFGEIPVLTKENVTVARRSLGTDSCGHEIPRN